MTDPIKINFGRFQAELTDIPKSARDKVELIYGDAPEKEFSDFLVAVKPSGFLRRWYRPKVSFHSNSTEPFAPLPLSQAFAFLEWGLNWCISTTDFSHLIVHSAVLVKNSQAIIFPALPGSGKSTLTTWLGLNGWAVYSDELAVIDTKKLTVEALYRPICLKNRSIDLVKEWKSDITITPPCLDTAKGTVAHAKLNSWDEFAQLQPVPISGVVFPKYDAKVDECLYEVDKLQIFEAICRNTFNFHVLGHTAFDTVLRLTESIKGLEVHYNDLQFMSSLLEDEILS